MISDLWTQCYGRPSICALLPPSSGDRGECRHLFVIRSVKPNIFNVVIVINPRGIEKNNTER